MTQKPAAGTYFDWRSRDGSSAGRATVHRVRSDVEEGLSPELEDYAGEWVEAVGTDGAYKDKAFTVMLGTDEKAYIDGKEIIVELLSDQARVQ